MKTCTAALVSAVLLTGCAGGSGPAPCEVFSPAPVILPNSKEEPRVEAGSTGDPTLTQGRQQDC